MKFNYETDRIYVKNDEGKIVVLATFPMKEGGIVDINHTFVDPSLRGTGLGVKLMEEFYDYAKKQGYKVIATCAFAVKWFEKYPEKQDILLK